MNNNVGKISFFSMFALWFGAAVSLAEIMTGSLLAPLGLAKGLTAIIAGHLIGTLVLALVGVIGFREKKPSLLASRISLGRQGSYLVSVFNIIQLVGWTAIMLIQCARSLQSITERMWGFDNFIILVVATGLLVGIWTLYMHKGVSIVNNIAVILLLGLTILLMKAVLSGGGAMVPAESGMSFGVALELSIIMPLSWVPLISDYTMNAQNGRRSFWGSFLGYFLGSSFMYATGLLAALYTGTSDPVGILAGMNLGLAALLIVILSTVTTTFLDVFSAVMSTLNLNGALSRRNLIILFTVLGTVLALVFPMEEYESFLYMIGSVFAPIFTVVLIDYFYLRADRSRERLNLPGLLAAALGVVAYYIAGGYELPVGSTLPAMLLTTAAYLILTKFYAKKNG